MNQGACTEEEQCFEHCVCEEMEHAGHVAETAVMTVNLSRVSYAKGHHHECNLRYGGEGENTFDVYLRASHGCGVEGCDGTHTCYERHGGVYNAVYREHAGYQIYAGNYHGGSVDQGRHGCRAFHGVGQPDVQRHHCRFTHTAYKYQHHGPGDYGSAHEGCAACLSEYLTRIGGKLNKVECVGIVAEYEYADEEA